MKVHKEFLNEARSQCCFYPFHSSAALDLPTALSRSVPGVVSNAQRFRSVEPAMPADERHARQHEFLYSRYGMPLSWDSGSGYKHSKSVPRPLESSLRVSAPTHPHTALAYLVDHHQCPQIEAQGEGDGWCMEVVQCQVEACLTVAHI